MKTFNSNIRYQSGVALLTIFLVVFSVGATVFFSSVNTHTVEVRRFQDMRVEMEKAKQSLIAYAMNYHNTGFDYVVDTTIMDEGPGRLICPDVDNDGAADSTAADCTDNVRGRLPESVSFGGITFPFNNAFVEIDQQFWYVVSPAFKEFAATNVNNLTAGTLSIDGESGYVAVIIAPGEALDGQDRSASQTTVANYLEQGNVSGTAFINSYPADPDAFNDQVIGIKAEELMLDAIKDDAISDLSVAVRTENARGELATYWSDNGSIPTTVAGLHAIMQNKGYGWLIDEGYTSEIYERYFYSTYPYIRYNLDGCTTYWYWFIPVSPYSPSVTYVSGTPC